MSAADGRFSQPHGTQPQSQMTFEMTQGLHDVQANQYEASEPEPTDRKHAWSVVIACSVLTFFFNGWTGAWGVLQTALMQSPSLSVTTGTMTFVGSLAIACAVAFSLLAVRLSHKVGARASALLGVVLLGLGVLCSSWTVDNIGGLFVTAGALIGLGSSLLYSVCNTVPVQWFSSGLGTANGVMKLGGGLGATILCITVQKLIDGVGIAWTFRIMGITVLAAGVAASSMIRERVPASRRPVTQFAEWSLFKRPPFVFIFLAGAIGTFALFVPPFFLPLFAHSLGLSASIGAWLTAAYNFCATIGRFLAGYACDILGAMNVLLLTMCLNAVSMLAIWPISSSLAPLLVFIAINGIANGAYFVVMPTAIVSVIGYELADVAMGMAITGWTGGYLMGSPLAGILISSTGADKKTSIAPYRAAILYAGGVALASSIFVLVARLRIDRKLVKRL